MEEWTDVVGAIDKGRFGGTATKTDESWQRFRLEADVLFQAQSSAGGIGIGSQRDSSFFALSLAPNDEMVRLFWQFIPPPGSGLIAQNKALSESFVAFPGIIYHLGLGFSNGQLSATLQSPVVWNTNRAPIAGWTSLAEAGQLLTLVQGDQVQLFSPEGKETSGSALEEQASETRTWEVEGPQGKRQWVGICVPARNQVFYARMLRSANGEWSWPRGFSLFLGSGVGQQAEEMIFPLSFAPGPDGRIYVLDAGNARIQVFDALGKYLTQWGRKGSGEGDFDFGSGRVPEDFAGSVVVDGEGYIYVADVGNRRIQKFAP